MNTKNILFAICLLMGYSLQAQTVYDLSFSNGQPNSGQYCIDINIGFDQVGGLATSNLVFSFNTEALRNPTLGSHVLSTPLVYQVPSVTQPVEGMASVNVVLNAATFGQSIGQTPSQLVRVCFDIEDPAETINLNWVVDANAATVVFLDQASPVQLAPGNLSDFSGSSFPVEWLDFNARHFAEDAILSWTTANETNNDYFEVERSLKGGQFESIGRVKGAGTTNEQQTYSFVDEEIVRLGERQITYRIKQIDFDGQYSYSPQAEINLNVQNGLMTTAYPNAFKEQLNIRFQALSENPVSLSILNLQGQQMWTVDSQEKGGEYQLNTQSWPAGIYYLHLYTGSENQVVKILKL
ncbi:MAG: T9SS type A sorting domain-containing protein [Bacteroidota bacterium]